MVVFLRIRPGQVPEEPQPEGLDPFRDWQAACSARNRLICSVSGIRDLKDFPQTPSVEGIKALSQGLGDSQYLAPVEQDWEDASPVEVHLGSCVNMGRPYTLFKEAEALSCVAISQPQFPRRVRSAIQGR